ncbi:MAG: hypothetical protein AB7N65_04230 [Vicinamibacterales bacterium]
MEERQRADTTGLPIDDRPEVHEAGQSRGRVAPVSIELDKMLRDGTFPDDIRGDERLRELPGPAGSDPEES